MIHGEKVNRTDPFKVSPASDSRESPVPRKGLATCGSKSGEIESINHWKKRVFRICCLARLLRGRLVQLFVRERVTFSVFYIHFLWDLGDFFSGRHKKFVIQRTLNEFRLQPKKIEWPVMLRNAGSQNCERPEKAELFRTIENLRGYLVTF